MAQLRISVVLEGDNEKHCPESNDGPLCLGIEGLLEQDYPLEHVDLILVGSAAQVERWGRRTETSGFGRVRVIAAEDCDYLAMKHRGARDAICPLLPFPDSDVKPGPRWLTTLVESLESGNAVAAGLTRMEWHGRLGPDSALMLAYGAVCWGAILGPDRVLGFHANNVGFRGELLDVAWYRTGLLRACAAQELFQAWVVAGRKAAFRREQTVVHSFSLDWWTSMHERAGRESLLARRIFPHWPHRWVASTGPLEPLLTAFWRVARDPGQWWRYAGACGVSKARRTALLPVAFLVSVATRGIEMWGGYAGLRDGSVSAQKALYLRARG